MYSDPTKVWVQWEVLCLMSRHCSQVPSGLEQHTSEIQRSVLKTTSFWSSYTYLYRSFLNLKSFTIAPFAATDSFLSYTMPLTNDKEYCIVHFWSYTRNFQAATCKGTRQGYLAWKHTAGYHISMCKGKHHRAQRLRAACVPQMRYNTRYWSSWKCWVEKHEECLFDEVIFCVAGLFISLLK